MGIPDINQQCTTLRVITARHHCMSTLLNTVSTPAPAGLKVSKSEKVTLMCSTTISNIGVNMVNISNNGVNRVSKTEQVLCQK